MDMKNDVGKALSLGFEIAIAVFLGAFIGYQLDMRFGSRPIGLVAGVALGGAAGMWNAIKLSIKEQ